MAAVTDDPNNLNRFPPARPLPPRTRLAAYPLHRSSTMQPDLLPTLLPLWARVVLRYAVGGLVSIGMLTALQGEHITADPEVQLIISGVLGALAAWLIEKARVIALRYHKPT